MNGRPLFVVLILAALGAAPAENQILHSFQALQPGDVSGQQAAVQNILAGTDDPAILLQAADLLQNRCIDPPVNTLEYWGPDAKTQGELRDSAEMLLRLFDRIETLVHTQSDAAAASMRSATDASQLQRWQQLTDEGKKASDEKLVAEYARLLAAEPEEKKALADQTIAAAKGSNSSDPKRQQSARLLMAKILLAADQPRDARVVLTGILQNLATDDIARQYQARYFLCISDLNAGNFAQAHTDLAALVAWQNQFLVGNYSNLTAGAEAAEAIYQYRLDSAQADQSESAHDKLRYDQSAVAALETLVRQQPSLKPSVLNHLGDRYAGATDIDHASPLILEALMQRGAAANADSQTLLLASRAAQLVEQRSDEFSPPTVDYAAALSAAILDRTGQSAAAEAYLTLAKRLQNHDVKTAGAALDRAIELFQTRVNGGAESNDYAAALTLAVGAPFERKYLLFAQSQTLMQRGDYRAALAVLHQVPSNDPHYVDAKLAEMICMRQLLDVNSQQSRSDTAMQIAALCNEISKQASGPSAIKAQAILLVAETEQLLRQPARTLERLQDLPASCVGLSDEVSFLDRGAELQISALLDLDRPVEAADVLAGTKNKINAPIAEMVKQLDARFDAAKNVDESSMLAEARVHVATWLMNHATTASATELNRDRLFYADSLRRAGKLEANGDLKRAELEKSLKLFQQVAAADSSESSDPTALLGAAGAQFDLEHYSEARDILISLLTAGRLGDGQGPAAEAYWEATYELLASNTALASQGQATAQQMEQTAAYLRRLYIQWGDQVGGKRWHSAFESLRKRIGPDFQDKSRTMQ